MIDQRGGMAGEGIERRIADYVLAPRSRRWLEADEARIARRWQAEAATLRARLTWKPNEIMAYQFAKIAMLVETAFACNAFYNQKYKAAGFRSGDLISWADYHALPTVTKEELVGSADALWSWCLLRDEEIFLSRTSGSSGRAIEVRQTGAISDAGILFYLRHYEQMLGRLRGDSDLLYEIYLAPQRVRSVGGRFPVVTVDNVTPPDLILKHIGKVRPVLLSGFPSQLLELAKLAGGRPLGIEAVCTNSESSTDFERRMISEGLSAPVFDEYSSEELYLIATQCRHGARHLIEDNVRADVYETDAEGLGRIVCTSLTNTVWPLIKYDQGDLVAIAEDCGDCSCGSHFRTLTSFCGRLDENLTRVDGTTLRSDIIMALYDRTLIPKEAGIAEFALIQTAPEAVELLCVPIAGEEINRTMVGEFAVSLQRLFGAPHPEISIHEVAEMPEKISVKRRVTLNLCRKTGGP